MEQHISVHNWLNIPVKYRHELVKMFNIPKSAYTVVEDNYVTSDGHTTEDLFAITLDKCKGFLNSSWAKGENLITLLDEVIKQKIIPVFEEKEQESEEVEETEVEETIVTSTGEVKSEIINVKPKRKRYVKSKTTE